MGAAFVESKRPPIAIPPSDQADVADSDFIRLSPAPGEGQNGGEAACRGAGFYMKRILIIAGEWRATLARSRFRAAAEGTAIGLLLGLIDVHSKEGDLFNPEIANAIAGAVLGLRHGVRAWQAWGPMGWCFYLIHRAAIAWGYRPPYVEEDAGKAIFSLFELVPAGVGLVLGALLWLFVSQFARDRGGASARVESRRPFTVAAMMATVALIGVQLAALRALIIFDPFFGFCTVYSEHYDEARFRSLRVGMDRAAVEKIMGRPLGVVPWNQDTGPQDREMWYYTDRPDPTANFHRRWVVFENGKVVAVINDFWYD
jgi:outer membrane protein assembly factor BamE (lipoprotein component of BamABCDE complex)